MKILSVVGARPQFVKLSPVAAALSSRGAEHLIVHTGQHYDANMSQVFFDDLGIPAPDVHLGIGSGTHGAQTGRILSALDPVLLKHRPDWVLVYGDTNSTLAGALAAVKLHLPLAHLEAGLRSFNRRMPEEINRVLTDHAADLCLAPTALAVANLSSEGLGERARLVGDVMADVSLKVMNELRSAPQVEIVGMGPDEHFVVATIHRAENTDDPIRLAAVLDALREVPVPVVLVAHPRLRAVCAAEGIVLGGAGIRVVDPLGYHDMMALLLRSGGLVTDSGGLQKEAFLLHRPCTTIRTETEWPETLVHGWNVLDAELSQLSSVAFRDAPQENGGLPYGEGHAADAVAQALLGAS